MATSRMYQFPLGRIMMTPGAAKVFNELMAECVCGVRNAQAVCCLLSPGHTGAHSDLLNEWSDAEVIEHDRPMLGQVFTPAALLARHVSGDWGDMDAHDKRANNAAVKEGNRIFSAYNLPLLHKVWIITEADRSSTTILLPEEY